MKRNNTDTPEKNETAAAERRRAFPLGAKNLKLMAVAFAVIVAGFLLMLGAPSTADAFNHDIYSFRRIVLGPGIAFLGYIFMAIAIIKK